MSDEPKTYWDYRVTRSEEGPGEHVFEVREVYYDEGVPHSWSLTPIAPGGYTVDELELDLARMQRALSKPILDITGDQLQELAAVQARPIDPTTLDGIYDALWDCLHAARKGEHGGMTVEQHIESLMARLRNLPS